MTVEFRQPLLPAVHAAPTAAPLRRRAVRAFIIGLVAALVLTVVGAMGTDAAPFGRRLAYWLIVVLPGSLLGLIIAFAVHSWGRLASRPWLEVMLTGLLVAIPHTFIVVVASSLMFGLEAITPGLVLWFGLIVLFVSLVLTAINHATAPELPKPAAAIAEAAPPPAPAEAAGPPALPPHIPALLAERLPPRLQSGRLLALAAEDHYLRIHTDLGSDLVLMRMVDAIALLADVPGARVHRSWWVARAAVTGTARDGDRLLLQLPGGLTAPVSRNARRDLAAAGWF
jgi:DNA-binding LytR/AlgR family response regulator